MKCKKNTEIDEKIDSITKKIKECEKQKKGLMIDFIEFDDKKVIRNQSKSPINA